MAFRVFPLVLLVGAALVAGCGGSDRTEEVPPPIAADAPPGPSAPLSRDLARFGQELFAASRGRPGGEYLDERAAAENWRPAPAALQPIYRTEHGWLAPLGEREVIVAHDGARGMVIVATMHGFDAAAAKQALEDSFELERLSLMNGTDGTMMSNYIARREGEEVAFIGLLQAVEGPARGVGLVGFVPAEVARREMQEGAPPREPLQTEG